MNLSHEQRARRARGACIRCGCGPLRTKNHCEPCRVKANEAARRSKARPLSLLAGPMAAPPGPDYSIDDATKEEIRRSLDPIEVIAARYRVSVSDVMRVRYGRRGEEKSA